MTWWQIFSAVLCGYLTGCVGSFLSFIAFMLWLDWRSGRETPLTPKRFQDLKKEDFTV